MSEDLLYTNTFVNTDAKDIQHSKGVKNEFYKYIKQKKEKEKVESYSEKNKKKIKEEKNDKNNRYYKELVTYINVDSRNRDKTKYPNQNKYKMNLGRSFSNVKSVSLKSTEFPNTQMAIKSSPVDVANNKVYWQIEDENNPGFAEGNQTYVATIREGNYTASSLQEEMMIEMNSVIRVGHPNKPFNNFVVSIDTITDIVSISSFNLILLSNSLNSIAGTGIITVTHTAHGFQSGLKIEIANATRVGGIEKDLINGPHVVDRIDDDSYRFDLSDDTFGTGTGIVASKTQAAVGGDITVGTGISFKLLWKTYTNTPGELLGFSSEDTGFSEMHQNIAVIKTIPIKKSNPTVPTIVETTINHELTTGDRGFIVKHRGSINDSRINDTEGYYVTKLTDTTFSIPADLETNNETLTLTLSQNKIEGFKVTNGGTNYTTPPTVTIGKGTSDTGDDTAEARATLGVSKITITDMGSGYINEPFIYIYGTSLQQKPWAIYPDLKIIWSPIIGFNIINKGHSYKKNSKIQLTITDPNGNGKEAEGYVVTDIEGKLRTVIITKAGYGYSENPTITINDQNGVDGVIKAIVAYGKITNIIIDNTSVIDELSNSILNEINTTYSEELGDNTITDTSFFSKYTVNNFKGVGYIASPSIKIVGGSGSGATATVIADTVTMLYHGISADESEDEDVIYQELYDNGTVNLTNIQVKKGDNYLTPTLTLSSPPTSGITATADPMYNSITSYSTSTIGLQYKGLSSITIAEPNQPDNLYKTTATAKVYINPINATTISYAGLGYETTIPPNVYITNNELDTDGNGAFIRAVVTTGVISTLKIEDSGTGYFKTPLLDIGPPTNPPTTFQAAGVSMYITKIDNTIENISTITVSGTIPTTYYRSGSTRNSVYINGTDYTNINNKIHTVDITGETLTIKRNILATRTSVNLSSTGFVTFCQAMATCSRLEDAANLNIIKGVKSTGTLKEYLSNSINQHIISLRPDTQIGSGYTGSALGDIHGTGGDLEIRRINRPIVLNGENYLYMIADGLGSMQTTGNIQDVYAKIQMIAGTGSVIFNSFISSPKIFEDTPLKYLEEIDFKYLNHKGELIQFNDLDHSFTLEVATYIDVLENTNYSSRRGIIDDT